MKNDALQNRYVSKSIPDFAHECKGDKAGIYAQKTNLVRPIRITLQAAKHIVPRVVQHKNACRAISSLPYRVIKESQARKSGGVAAVAEDSNDLPLHLPFAVPYKSRNEDRLQFGVRRLKAHAVMIFFLIKALQGRAAADAFLHMDRDDDIAILACRLWLNHHIIAIADVVLDHRTSLHDQGIGAVALHQVAAYIDRLVGIRKDIEWFTGSNRACDRDTDRWLYQFDATALLRLTGNKALLLQHSQMIIDMTCAGNLQLAANLPIGRWHPLRLHV